MKKAIILLMTMTAAFVMAMETQVVGYNTVTLDKPYTLLGVSFTAVTNDTLPISINEAVKYVEGMAKANVSGDADQIQVQNAEGAYDVYYMSNGKNAKGENVEGLEGKWSLVGQATPATTSIPAGTAIWYCRNTSESPLSVNVAGGLSVRESDDIQVNLPYKLFANPYPTALPLNDGVSYVEGMTRGTNVGGADQIQVQNAEGLYDVYYMSNGKNAKGATVEGLEGKWVLAGTAVAATNVIPVGRGAWFCRHGDEVFTITVTRPYVIE